MRRIAGIWSALYLIGSASGEGTNALVMQSSSTFEPHDSLLVQITRIPFPEFLQLAVDDQGAIKLPYIGTIQVTNMTPEQVELKVASTYMAMGVYTNPRVRVYRHLVIRQGVGSAVQPLPMYPTLIHHWSEDEIRSWEFKSQQRFPREQFPSVPNQVIHVDEIPIRPDPE